MQRALADRLCHRQAVAKQSYQATTETMLSKRSNLVKDILHRKTTALTVLPNRLASKKIKKQRKYDVCDNVDLELHDKDLPKSASVIVSTVPTTVSITVFLT
jgi:hypothetical protein